MATKKQKRERAYQKHLNYMEELRLSGLEAQKKDREHREHKKLEAQKDTNSQHPKSRGKNTIKERN